MSFDFHSSTVKNFINASFQTLTFFIFVAFVSSHLPYVTSNAETFSLLNNRKINHPFSRVNQSKELLVFISVYMSSVFLSTIVCLVFLLTNKFLAVSKRGQTFSKRNCCHVEECLSVLGQFETRPSS
jgi:hypothetical protein